MEEELKNTSCEQEHECMGHCKDHECHCENNCDDESSGGCNCEHHEEKNKKKKDKSKKLEYRIEELEKALKESEEKALLAKAEMINYRKRKDEEVERILKYANEDMIRELLPVVDNFERAIKLDDNNLEDELSKFLEGFKMIYCNLISILEKESVKQIDGANKPFDPTYHQAVITEPSDKEKDMVLEVLQKGYLYKDKVIRPAMVKVSE